jgi:integrase
MANAWVYQDDKQVKKHGAEAASHYVGWIEPDGTKRCKSCGPGRAGDRAARKLRDRLTAELTTGTYQTAAKRTWEAFRKEYAAVVLAGLGIRHRDELTHALDQFERLVKPKKLEVVTSAAVAKFISLRRVEPGMKPGSDKSPATVNKELRCLRAAFRKARRLKWIKEAPEIDFLKMPGKLPTYTRPEDFAKLYAGCDAMRWPDGQPYPAADWWRALLIVAYMTGWRISQILALRRADVDLDAETAVSRAEDNKGKRDVLLSLHPLAGEHLRKLSGFDPFYFPWNHSRKRLFDELHKLQRAAKVKPSGKDFYGFHDLRRAFATMNADRVTADVLQALMQHKDYQTTQRYIAIGRQLKPAAHNLYVPDVKPALARV